MGARISDKCVECHMTKHPVIGGLLRSSESSAPLVMWDHFIRARIDASGEMLHDSRSGGDGR
jgi:hypothetical protein